MSSPSSSSEVILDSNEKSAEVSSLSSSLHPLPPSYQSSRSLRGGFEPGDSRRMTGFCDLPEKAVVEIVQWFVAKHLKNSQSNSYVFRRNSPLYCLQLRNDKSRNWFMSFNKVENWTSRIYFDVKEFNVPRCITVGYGSHCNGILFLADRKTNKVLFFNPALRELKLLQSSCFGSNFKTLVMAGFGYDAIADVYKVVRVVCLCSTAVGARIGAEVCTLGNHGDSWREIKMKIEIDVSSLTLDGSTTEESVIG
ncbi:hypothetical protein TIFTF001_000956 [Ficus carica]|uniref:F-box associated beta-propeller type 3 domain-containing protein n=1 Tax=Ficus carica TaxID=3494 RepID=A0AA87YXT8_FICCA|nr:hypothetical protein TIFTF001_000956 [Ficus carica]